MTEKTVFNILHDIQKEIKAPKGQENKFGGYKYRSCEDILEAVKPLLPEGATLTIEDDIILVGDRYYVKATSTLMYKGTGVSTSAFAREAPEKKGMDSAQITGATSSYARKYSLNGLLLIDDTKDADATNDHGKKDRPELTGSIVAEGNRRSGNKAVDKAVTEAIGHVDACVDMEGLQKVYTYHYKFLQDSGASQDQLGMLEMQKDNVKIRLQNQGR